ncbi:MAG: hypothetical protein ABFD81_18175 [Syntrophaceae bacterium]
MRIPADAGALPNVLYKAAKREKIVLTMEITGRNSSLTNQLKVRH